MITDLSIKLASTSYFIDSVMIKARAMNISDSTVGRIWRANGLKPHRIDTFKVSNDPNFSDKL